MEGEDELLARVPPTELGLLPTHSAGGRDFVPRACGGSYLDVFDVRLQMPARWQVGWNVLRSREAQLPARP